MTSDRRERVFERTVCVSGEEPHDRRCRNEERETTCQHKRCSRADAVQCEKGVCADLAKSHTIDVVATKSEAPSQGRQKRTKSGNKRREDGKGINE